MRPHTLHLSLAVHLQVHTFVRVLFFILKEIVNNASWGLFPTRQRMWIPYNEETLFSFFSSFFLSAAIYVIVRPHKNQKEP
jgi:hypothetical protein